MKNITFFHKIRNYTRAGKNNKVGLISSVGHSLRITNERVHEMNHEASLTDKNIYLTQVEEGEVLKLKQVQNSAALYSSLISILDRDFPEQEAKNTEREEIQNRLSSVRCKFKKYKKTSEESKVFDSILEASSASEVAPLRGQLEQMEIKRKNQKLAQVDNYSELLDQLDNAPAPKAKGENLKTLMQEQIFKIPLDNKIGLGQVTPQHYAKLAVAINRKINPDNKIEALAIHLDEPGKEAENFGLHVHCFINGRSRNGDTDLLKKQHEFAINYCKENAPDIFETFQKDYQRNINAIEREAINTSTMNDKAKNFLSRQEEIKREKAMGRFKGQCWQEMIRIESNNIIFNELGLNIEYHRKTQNNQKLINDANKNIIDREFSGSKIREQRAQEQVKSIEAKAKYIEKMNLRKLDEYKENQKINERLIEEREQIRNDLNRLDKEMISLIEKIQNLIIQASLMIKEKLKSNSEITEYVADEINNAFIASKPSKSLAHSIVKNLIIPHDFAHHTEIANRVANDLKKFKF
ncbi:TPA: hypothetical protein KD874_004826 [Vibrio parahaemolyticus]|nr:hypothetical protein [Vibrio fluvialis]HBC3993247.1 hypothetical protein [Vibrio parahaemolyticus]